jgi:phage shock protein A
MSAAYDEFVSSVRNLVDALMPRRMPPAREPPRAVYERVIEERRAMYKELKESLAQLLYLRQRLAGEIHERRAEIARLHDEARVSAKEGDDDRALLLLEEKHRLFAELSNSEEQLAETKKDTEEAKARLLRFLEQLRSLEREKVEAITRQAVLHTRARMRDATLGPRALATEDAISRVRGRLQQEREAEDLERALADLDGADSLLPSSARLDLMHLKRR